MATFELQSDEVVLYEGTATCKTYKGNLQLTLTSQKLVFEKEKGLFKKERELVVPFALCVDDKTSGDFTKSVS